MQLLEMMEMVLKMCDFNGFVYPVSKVLSVDKLPSFAIRGKMMHNGDVARSVDVDGIAPMR
ncbi:hypothetical protein [Bifidobacterium samirii]|uniref:hypothetical protein n=1 Tax=Bifidobacterium samirii TaxID=2306974 RepID=UPI000F7DFA39|nr:hypothetical protein [Bifidobacterium samirii]